MHRRLDKASCETSVTVTCGEVKKQIDWRNRDNRQNTTVSIASENNRKYEQKWLSMALGPV
jgi:hypothetical protein